MVAGDSVWLDQALNYPQDYNINDEMWATSSGDNHLYGPSTANQRIESFWGPIKTSGMQWWKTFFDVMEAGDDYNYRDKREVKIAQFVFGDLFAASLKENMEQWNAHRIRKQKRSRVSGGKPKRM
jgi:hypothetical protein